MQALSFSKSSPISRRLLMHLEWLRTLTMMELLVNFKRREFYLKSLVSSRARTSWEGHLKSPIFGLRIW